MRKIVYALILLPWISFGQGSSQPDAAHIKLKLKKLNVLGSVLYVAAHPDDENTRIITDMADGKLVETAYLSMTRGDGGQNLIGPEIRDLLGLIRTQELLAARRVDGGKQFFTRANDFGFSKSAEETFRIWNKDEILSDVVRVFRQFQPDVIITRFPPDERAGHGHHTASAVMAREAFDAAAQPSIFPDQVKAFGTWQAKRLFTNTGRWWNQSINENTPGIVVLNVGGYSPLLGESYAEIAAISRSQHKSQGFGSSGARGDQLEFLEFEKGDRADKDIFEGINITWGRVKNAEKVQLLVDKVNAQFDEEHPASSVPMLLQIRKELLALEPGLWQKRKLTEVEQLIVDCLGLFVEVAADNYWVAPGQQVQAAIEIVNRSNIDVTVDRIVCKDLAFDSLMSLSLKDNVPVAFKSTRQIDAAKIYSDPYWLREPHSVGLFTVPDKTLIGKPENDPAISLSFQISVAGQSFSVARPMIYKWTDRVKGEQSRPFEVVPPVFVNLSENVFIFNDGQPRDINVVIKSSSDHSITGNLKLRLPAGWRAEPLSIPIALAARDDEETKSFKVFPSKEETRSSIRAFVEMDGRVFDKALQTIDYDHIPIQTLLPTAEATLVRINLKKEGAVIGYVKGAGDDVPVALRSMGYEVWEMKNEEVTAENLKRVDAVVLGIRAVNVNDRLPYIMPELLAYVKQGGTMIVQYNTNGGIESVPFSPYPLSLSRDRVTEEDAVVRLLKPDHPILNSPNKINASDFDGWVQERGLYFPNKWDPNYEAILSMNDEGEAPMDGSLLVAKYGQGYYVYTGLSFFRELPEGVAGAYKLFANIVSVGKQAKPENTKVKNKAK